MHSEIVAYNLFYIFEQPCKGVLLFGPPGTGILTLSTLFCFSTHKVFVVVVKHTMVCKYLHLYNFPPNGNLRGH